MKSMLASIVRKPIGIILRKIDKQRYKNSLSSQLLKVPREGLYLNYAGQSLPDAEGILHGGRVKLKHLARAYPEKNHIINILYLVSSATPKYANFLVEFLKGKGVKFVWNQNGVAYPAWAGESYLTTNSKLASLLHMADYVIYQSEFCRLSADRYLGVPDVPCKVIYNPVDTDEFTPPSVPPSVDTWRLLIAGTHLQSDRVLLILETLANLKNYGHNVKLVIAGNIGWSCGESETIDAIKKLKLTSDVELLGAYKQEQAPEIYQSAHILFHIKYKDPCPTVPIEAMACGVPVIGSLSGGMPELVSDQGGVLLDVPDDWDEMCYPAIEDMVGAVINIMGDLEVWRHKARQRAVKKFSKDFWLEQHRMIFTELI